MVFCLQMLRPRTKVPGLLRSSLQELTGHPDLSGELAQGDSFFTGTEDDGRAEVTTIALESRKGLVDDMSGLEGPALPQRRNDWLALFKSLDCSTEDSLGGPQVLAGPAAGFEEQFELPNDCIAMGSHCENQLFTSSPGARVSSAPRPGRRPPDETESMPEPSDQVPDTDQAALSTHVPSPPNPAQSESDSGFPGGLSAAVGILSP
jgi:hypothetical protein